MVAAMLFLIFGGLFIGFGILVLVGLVSLFVGEDEED